MRARLMPTLVSLVTMLVLIAAYAAPVAARSDGAKPPLTRGLAVHHGPVEAPLVTPGSDGHQLGDVRVASVETTDANGAPTGRLEATLTTTAVDVPAVGDEQRIGVLVFTFGEDGADQVVVQGSAHYPAQGPTIASGDVTVRPIVGGSGRFAAVRGDAVTTHLTDGDWIHELRIVAARPVSRLAPSRGMERYVERQASRAERRADRAERRADRAERRLEREAERAERRTRRAERRRSGIDEASPAIDGIYANVPADGTGVVRTDLGTTEPGSAPGEELGLWHYVIPAGEELAPHTHPGWQLARVTAGELEYVVESGESVLLRADGSSTAMGPGTYLLATGDGVVENPELIHYGANRTDDPVTIISATLFNAGEPISTLVDLDASDDGVPGIGDEEG